MTSDRAPDPDAQPDPKADPTRIGIVGLGLLGTAIAGQLIRAGCDIHGCDLRAERLIALRNLGGTPHPQPRDLVADGISTLLFCVMTTEQVRSVVEPLLSLLPSGALLIDCSTGDPDSVTALGRDLRRQGHRYVDATVAGSSTQVAAGEAMVLAGGAPEDLERAAAVLNPICRKFFLLGEIGAGSRMKLVFNMALGLHRLALAESLAFAESQGIAAEQALRVLQAGAASSRVMENKGPRMVSGDFAPEARLSQHLKDVRLMQQVAARSGAEIPLTELHRKILERAELEGLGELDNSAVIQLFRCSGILS